MEYFRLRMDKRITKPLVPLALPEEYKMSMTYADFSVMEEAVAAYYKYKTFPVWCDIIFRPCFMFSSKVKAVLEEIIPEDKEKLIFLLPEDIEPKEITAEMVQSLWVPYVESTDFLHEATETDGTGLISRLVVDREKAGDSDILHSSLRAEEVWLFSRRALEAVLAAASVGAVFEAVECR